MLGMTRSDRTPRVDPRFDGFLQAPIDEDRKERLLSVLSALARLNLDPWQEAASLAAQPRDAAALRLASLIATLPDTSPASRDSAAIAARLVALLPRASSAPAAPPNEDEGMEAPEERKTTSLTMVAFIVFVVLFGTWMVTGWPVDGLLSWMAPNPDSTSPLGVSP